MKGYIFEYYKYIQYFKESLDDIKNLLASDSENSILTFGEYDRLKITSFTKFDRFRDLSTLARNWIGNRQSILLYDLLEEPEFIYVEEPKNLGKFKERKTSQLLGFSGRRSLMGWGRDVLQRDHTMQTDLRREAISEWGHKRES